ncbi:hypothetical protein [Sorangium cellulosum]|nr:hypothetical protein [Sorangium cellulosum]
MGTILPAVGALVADFGGLDEVAGRRDAAWEDEGSSGSSGIESGIERLVGRRYLGRLVVLLRGWR